MLSHLRPCQSPETQKSKEIKGGCRARDPAQSKLGGTSRQVISAPSAGMIPKPRNQQEQGNRKEIWSCEPPLISSFQFRRLQSVLRFRCKPKPLDVSPLNPRYGGLMLRDMRPHGPKSLCYSLPRPDTTGAFPWDLKPGLSQ